MPSVRDKYRSAVHELKRADSIPERFQLFRKIWRWIVEASRTTTAFLGFLLLPLYLILIGSIFYNSCGDNHSLPLELIFLGVLLILCALYLPAYNRAKVKAREARNSLNIGSLNPASPTGPLTQDEIKAYVPFHLNRVSKFAYFAICGILPTMALQLYRGTEGTAECHPIIYWSALVISIIYFIWLISILSACFLLCCIFVCVPTCIEKCKRPAEEIV